MRFETLWGPWEPLAPEEGAEILSGLSAPWWIAGGYAIEAFVGRSLREHHDLDVGVLRRDQLDVQRFLAGWELHAADPPGTLRPWLRGEVLPAGVHDIWARRDAHSSWKFQIMLDESDREDWVYRRAPRIRRPLSSVTWASGGIPCLAPEIQLLFKSKGLRDRDVRDFDAALPLLTGAQREWLRTALATTAPDHTWLPALGAT